MAPRTAPVLLWTLLAALACLGPGFGRQVAAHPGDTHFRLVPRGNAPTRLGIGRGVTRPPRFRFAASHILVNVHPRANTRLFFASARRMGLQALSRVRGTSWLRMRIPPGVDPRQAAQAARRLPGVLRAAPDPIVRINDTVPCDPFCRDDPDPSTEDCDPSEDENCDPSTLSDQWGLFKVGAPAAWDTQRGSSSVVIAILDTGVDLDHDDLFGNIWTNPNDPVDGVDNDNNGIVDDRHGADFCGDNIGDPSFDDPAAVDGNPDLPMGGEWIEDEEALPFGLYFEGDPAVGDAIDNDGDGFSIDAGVFHGTFVSGVAAAMTNNHNPSTGECEGLAGAAWYCRIMPVRVINAEGWGFGSDAAEGLRYAADMGADVINCSWGISLENLGPAEMEEVRVIEEAVRYAAGRGCIIVAAAGNGGEPGEAVTGLDFPGNMRETIAVGSSQWQDLRSEFSSTALPGEIPDNGIDDDGNGWIDDVLDVVAPGELIWSTYVLSAYDALLFSVLGTDVDPGSPSYLIADGTSFSTPLVSGYVGLLLSQNPGISLSQVRQILRSNALDLRDPNGTGQNLPGYDVYSGFGRLRMAIPTLPGSANRAFVQRAYADLLEREPEPGASHGWSDYLDRGGSRLTLARTIVYSTEYRTLLVRNLYAALLQRQADPGGLYAWVSFMNAGGTTEQVEEQILGSDEYFVRRGGGSNRGFLQAAYLDVLGRPPDPGGEGWFLAVLAAGRSRVQVAGDLVNSGEGRSVRVRRLFLWLLRRDADPSGLSWGMDALNRGVKVEELIAAIVASDEYYRRP